MSNPRPATHRERQANETRRLIVESARRLFAAQGYGATSITQIAAEAGVAVPTIYTSVGTKLRLLELLNEQINDDAGVADLVPMLLSSRDPVELIGLQVTLCRRLNERAGDLIATLRSAATVEPDMATPFAAGMHRHREGMHATARILGTLGALRADITVDDAAALLDVTLTPDAWTALTRDHGLSWDAAEALLSRSVAHLLLPNTRTRRKQRNNAAK